MLAQGLSGVAKDLSKMSAKSAVKLLAPETEGGLFRWVAILTGSKNAVKGAGFFIGAVARGIRFSRQSRDGLIINFSFCCFDPAHANGLTHRPQGRKIQSLSKNANVNWLSLARVFLFGARDVGLLLGSQSTFMRFYRMAAQGNPRAFSNRWLWQFGSSFMGWCRAAHRILRASTRFWCSYPGCRTLGLDADDCTIAYRYFCMRPDATTLNATVVLIALLLFGAIFAVNSSLHSYLILEFNWIACHDGCWFLLHGKCIWTFNGDAFVWDKLSNGGRECVFKHRCIHVDPVGICGRRLIFQRCHCPCRLSMASKRYDAFMRV